MNFQNNKVEKSILNYHQSPANHPLNSHSISLMNAALIQAPKNEKIAEVNPAVIRDQR